MANPTIIFNGSMSPPAGSAYLGGITDNGVQLIYDLTGATGSPSLVITLQEADPFNPSTPLAGGKSISTDPITGNTTASISLTFISSTVVLVSWTLSGGSFTNGLLSIAQFNSTSVMGQVEGLGKPGTPMGGLLTIQGSPSGTPVPITGSISATNPSVGANSTAAPTSSTQIGFLSGSNLVPVSSTNPIPVTGLSVISGTVTANQGSALSLSGAWPVEVTDGTNVLGTSSHPLRIDPTGTTTQPISGSVTATVSGSVSVSNFPATQPVSGTVTANAGTGVFSIAESVAALTSLLSFDAVNSSSGTTVILVPAVVGQTIRVFKLFLVFGGTTNATFWDGTGPTTVLSGNIPFLANGSIVLDVDTIPWFITSSGNALILNLSSSVSVNGVVYYTQS